MGTITRSFANNITTSGVLLPASLTNNSIANVTEYNAAVATGGMKLISTQTASNSASISFTTGINSTYKEYQFWFVDIHPATDGAEFQFNLSTDSGSNYNVTKTTSAFQTYHDEGDTLADVAIADGYDLAQSTSFATLADAIGNASKKCVAGSMQLFNPSSTTYVKHYIARVNRISNTSGTDYTADYFTAGYGNTTSAVNAVQFKMDSGNFDGTILLFGIK